MSKTVIYSSLDFLVTDDEGVVNLEQRNRGAVAIGAAAAFIGLLGWWIRIRLDPASAYTLLLTFFCVIMAISSASLLLGALYFTFRKRGHRFDPHTGMAKVQNRVCALDELSAPALKTVTVGSTRIEKLVTQHAGNEITLMSSTSEGALQPVQQALSRVFAAHRAAQPVITADNVAATTVDAWGRFLPTFLLLFGALWSGVGFLTMPDVILGSRRTAGGVLLWPLGLWLIALGLLEIVCLWRGKSFFAGESKVIKITLMLFMASYFLLCFR